MSGTIWIPEAERLGDGSIGGAMDTPDRKPRVTWHTTESGDGNAAFDAVARYLIAETYEPHILYDPRTDRLGQFGPLNESARALQNWGTTRTNRTGKVNIQIEVLAHAALYTMRISQCNKRYILSCESARFVKGNDKQIHVP